jgi:hypothetical protein
MTARPWRVRRLIELRCPDVIVLEEGGEFAGEITDHVAHLAQRPGVVLVSEKWGPVDSLVHEVERAAQQRPNGSGRRHLRVVSDNS